MKTFLTSLLLVLLVFFGGFAALVALTPKHNVFQEATERVPAELVRYALFRLEGHTRLELAFKPALLSLQRYFEQPLPLALVDAQQHGKGQQKHSLPQQRYNARHLPVAVEAALVHRRSTIPITPTEHRVLIHEIFVKTNEELAQAMRQAQAGDTITLLPGEYSFGGKMSSHHAGRFDAPIYVRAGAPGTVKIKLKGGLFYINQPHWVFENLHLRGSCGSAMGPCEHAFHIVGNAASTVIRNNHMQNFLAHIKVNGQNGNFPDGGLVQFNTFANEGNYGHKGAMTPLDLVGASYWNIADNLFHHFVKEWSKHASYGIFMKGGGQKGRIERNFLVCTTDGNISHYGSRVGISLGGGLTGAEYCPDKTCIYEHADGVVANNIVVHCNDFGIDNNRSIRSIIAHNTLVNTYGIDVRDTPSSALIYGNYLRGNIVAKKGGELQSNDNDDSLPSVTSSENSSQFALPLLSEKIVSTHPSVSDDFCGVPRQSTSRAGAIDANELCR